MSESPIHNPVGWFEIYVNDMPRAKAFYQAVLGTQFTRLQGPGQPPGMEMWAFPMHQNAMGATGALVKMPGLDAGGHNVIVYFMCGDCAVEAAKVEKAGGRIHMQKTVELARQDFLAMAEVLENHMQGRQFAVGDRISAADLVMAYTLDWGNEAELLSDFPALRAYLENIYRRPKAAPRIADAFASLQAGAPQ